MLQQSWKLGELIDLEKVKEKKANNVCGRKLCKEKRYLYIIDWNSII